MMHPFILLFFSSLLYVQSQYFDSHPSLLNPFLKIAWNHEPSLENVLDDEYCSDDLLNSPVERPSFLKDSPYDNFNKYTVTHEVAVLTTPTLMTNTARQYISSLVATFTATEQMVVHVPSVTLPSSLSMTFTIWPTTPLGVKTMAAIEYKNVKEVITIQQPVVLPKHTLTGTTVVVMIQETMRYSSIEPSFFMEYTLTPSSLLSSFNNFPPSTVGVPSFEFYSFPRSNPPPSIAHILPSENLQQEIPSNIPRENWSMNKRLSCPILSPQYYPMHRSHSERPSRRPYRCRASSNLLLRQYQNSLPQQNQNSMVNSGQSFPQKLPRRLCQVPKYYSNDRIPSE